MRIITSVLVFVFFYITLLQEIPAQTLPQWLHYTTENSPLPTNYLHNIVVDDSNRKWISTDCDGIIKIENDNWNIMNTSNSAIPSDCIMNLAIDHNSNLWAGGWNNNFNLAKYDGNNWTVWNGNNSPIEYDYVQSIEIDSSNKVWIVSNYPPDFNTDNNLFRFDGDTSWFNALTFSSFNGYRKILISGDSVIIATTNSTGKLLVLKSDGSTYEIGDFIGTYVTDLKKDQLGNIWIAAGHAGWGYLYVYDGVSFSGYLQYTATSIEIDNENNVWIGTESIFPDDTTKLIKYNGTEWIEYSASNSPLPVQDIIYDLAFDKLGNLWITTSGNGLFVFNEDGITPVELTSFNARVSNNNVLLNWKTSTETNNQGFEIERSQISNPKSQIWDMVGLVEGKGTTTEIQNYNFTDLNLSAGKYSYRLKQIDFDGTFEYSNVVEVEVGLPDEFSLSQNYPNPFNPITKIKFQIPLLGGDKRGGLVTLKVYDVLGNEVVTLVNEEKQPGVYEVEFDGSNLSSGIYYYTLNVGEFKSTRKFVLLK